MAGSTSQPEQPMAFVSKTYSLKTLMMVVTGASVFMAIARHSLPLAFTVAGLSLIVVPAIMRTVSCLRRHRRRGESNSLLGCLGEFFVASVESLIVYIKAQFFCGVTYALISLFEYLLLMTSLPATLEQSTVLVHLYKIVVGLVYFAVFTANWIHGAKFLWANPEDRNKVPVAAGP